MQMTVRMAGQKVILDPCEEGFSVKRNVRGQCSVVVEKQLTTGSLQASSRIHTQPGEEEDRVKVSKKERPQDSTESMWITLHVRNSSKLTKLD